MATSSQQATNVSEGTTPSFVLGLSCLNLTLNPSTRSNLVILEHQNDKFSHRSGYLGLQQPYPKIMLPDGWTEDGPRIIKIRFFAGLAHFGLKMQNPFTPTPKIDQTRAVFVMLEPQQTTENPMFLGPRPIMPSPKWGQRGPRPGAKTTV